MGKRSRFASAFLPVGPLHQLSMEIALRDTVMASCSFEECCDGVTMVSVKPPGLDSFTPNSLCLLLQMRLLRLI